MKKILVLSGSLRIKGNSDLICDEFTRGAKEAENDVDKIHVASKKIAQCLACYYCREHHGECVQKDAMADVLQKMINADVIVPSSAVFFYSITAQLKAVIDRTVARWLEVKNKEFYFIVTMVDEDLESANRTLADMQGYVDCVQGGVVKGTLSATAYINKVRSKDPKLCKAPTKWTKTPNLFFQTSSFLFQINTRSKIGKSLEAFSIPCIGKYLLKSLTWVTS